MPPTRPHRRTAGGRSMPRAVPTPDAAPVAGVTAAQIAAYSPVALLAVDRHCRIVFANIAATQLLDLPAAELLGQCICDLLRPHEGLAPEQWCPSHRLFAGQERRRGARETVVCVRGERRSALVAVAPLDESTPPDGATLSIIPVRHEGALQEQRRHLVARLLHDLRTPLSGIGVAAELLDPAAGDVPPGIITALRMHHADMLRYVSELADFTSLDVDARLPTAHPLALDDALEAVLWRLSPHIQRHEQTLHIANSVTRPLLIAQQYLEQALMAVVFDISTYATEQTTLDIRAREGIAHAVITFEGHGSPLQEGEVGALTDPYLRVRESGPAGGLMSLAATKHALEHYGGTLQVVAGPTSLCISLTVPLTDE